VRVLAVDTTTARESVALAEGGRVRGEVRLDPVDSHSTRLMPAIAFLLEGLGLVPGDVDGYAVAAGPGSFTGLRVGIGTVQGLALAGERPCAALSALDALAARAAGTAEWIVAVMEAHRGEVFGGVYDAEGRPRREPLAAPLGTLLEQVPDGAAFVGDAVERYRSAITAGRPGAVFPRRSLFLAGTVALMGEAVLARGQGRPASELRPLYLREADIRKAESRKLDVHKAGG
jgi:tRNA threonylcarbamoyladenosine biosynthesis protein TsaB